MRKVNKNFSLPRAGAPARGGPPGAPGLPGWLLRRWASLQGRFKVKNIGSGLAPLLHSLPLPSPSSSIPLLSPFPPSFATLPLEVGPLNTARGSGERYKLTSGVWGRAPAEIEF